MEIVRVQKGADMILNVTVSNGAGLVDLTSATVSANVVIASTEVSADVVLTNPAGGECEISVPGATTQSWEVGALGFLRILRSDAGRTYPMGVAKVRVL
ncbi:MAG: hypothetical protein AAGF76_09415 [Pseudomonadota bacterium]